MGHFNTRLIQPDSMINTETCYVLEQIFLVERSLFRNDSMQKFPSLSGTYAHIFRIDQKCIFLQY